MARLFPLLPFRADETHWSWAARMAAFHIRGPIETFLRDLGLDPFVLSIGDPDEVARLCATAGQDPGPVLRNTLMRHTSRSWRLGEEVLTDSLCPQRDLRFCPACLAEDDAVAKVAGQNIAIHRRERLIWRLKPIRSCPTHRLPLIRRDRPGGADGKGVFADSVPETTAMLEEIARNAEPCPGSPLQTYIADRIAGRHGPAWPDSLRLEQAIRITELLGTALEFGPHVAFDDLSAPDQDAASACGWSYIVDGESGIRGALQILQTGFDPTPMPRRGSKWDAFGSLLDELHHPAPGSPFRRIFDEHIESTAES
ncbi:TniQ family protein [Paracoccus versutus]|uniref:TniQ family protein n=1 Tax=Paracoccus versutus TaxID=34007 RepID=UPI000DF770A2|nr:TniQ family protein [Paracoccus versutus]RDD72233.1 hypothetical protein DVR11_06675 [Paracoccus versutus]